MRLKLAVGAMQGPGFLASRLRRDRPPLRDFSLLGLGVLGLLRSLCFLLGQHRLRRRGNRFRNGLHQVADAQAMLGADRKHIPDPQLAEVFGGVSHGLALDLVHGQEQGLAAVQQQAHQVVIGAGQLGARVHHQHQRVGLLQRHLGLVVDFGRDQLGIVGHDAARIDQAKLPPGPFVLAIDAVARDARLVAYNRAAAFGEPVEERGFAHVGPAHYGHQR